MKQIEIEHLTRKLFKKNGRSITLLENELDKDVIHDFRVGIKELRAFLRLLALEKGKACDLKIPKKIKKLYTLTGKARDIQLQILRIDELFKTGSKPNGYLHLLQKQLKRLEKNLTVIFKKGQLAVPEKKVMKKLPGHLQPETVTNFIQQKILNIHTLAAMPVLTDNELHTIRKNIKDIIYIFKIVEEYAVKLVPALLIDRAQLENAEGLAYELGLFNDLCIALSLLEPAFQDTTEPEELEQLRSLYSKWDLEKYQAREKSVSKLKTMLF